MKDRGHIKWTSLKLPQHRELLQKLWDTRDHILPPELEEQAYEQIQQVIHTSMRQNKEVTIQYFKENRIENVTGVIFKYNELNRTVTVKSSSESTLIIKLIDISSASE